ncbi:PHA/PHB synthase family protein [Spiribacter halobius]|uniref:Poly-beta-hydroxybutyrate polymerase n=1 Tax=Sediminicurvatus halobius TaxID=2182432 RepID=A0A2U2N2P5_9GAMM|nr:alpha/beta fold hydrolase [Spiribacter halobius]PWG63343.1 poly-beta-hydroxybutyrate polymerase [Spiribacter halobius]UEX79178.1 alpha/beta fold hydrolase [Spiribacter halobius]
MAARVHARRRPAGGCEADALQDLFTLINRTSHATLGRFTGGVSPVSIVQAYADWASHLGISPGKQALLATKLGEQARRLWTYAPRATGGGECERCIEPLPNDHRFDDEQWQRWPYNLIHQSFLLGQQWWHNATVGVDGVSPHHEDVVNFVTRQLLDVCAPSNSPLTNPKVAEQTFRTGGANFIDGGLNFLEDLRRGALGEPPAGAEHFRPGEHVALTPGKVIHRNRLIEVIQYSPATDEVQAEPVLVIPAWIMKYYILDLSPENSLVRWLVEQGHTVFMLSWKNPGSEDRDLGMEDYRQLGVMEALDAVNAVLPERKVHAVGYCLGGTLLSIAAAAMARANDHRLATLTLFASETDFEEPGELELFIDDSQVSFLEDLMWQQGYLDKWQMRGAFVFLRSNDLIWSVSVKSYLMGEKLPMMDLMAWSTDATRLPYRMHSEYLRYLYLDNALAEGQYYVGEHPVLLSDISTPMFVVGTRTDHIAPWRSVYKIHLLAGGDVTFLLTSGGHNAGVISEPGHRGRVYQVADKPAGAPYVDAQNWYDEVPEREGSWWPEWQAWLVEHSSGASGPPGMGAPDAGYTPLEDAPGNYVLQS